MMAWIIVSLLSNFVGAAVVAFSPEANAAPTIDLDGEGFPPKPETPTCGAGRPEPRATCRARDARPAGGPGARVVLGAAAC